MKINKLQEDMQEESEKTKQLLKLQEYVIERSKQQTEKLKNVTSKLIEECKVMIEDANNIVTE